MPIAREKKWGEKKENETERGLHQQIWDKQVGQGSLAQAANFD